MSALQAVRVRDHRRHGLLLEGRYGADDEDTRGAVAGDGAEDYVVPGGRILGFSDRHLRRIREHDQEFGYDGLFDRRATSVASRLE